MSESNPNGDTESAYCRGARVILMIRDCALPTTTEIAEVCGMSQRQALRMLSELAATFPIYQECRRWLWNGDERGWAVGDLVERVRSHHDALDVLVEELRGM